MWPKQFWSVQNGLVTTKMKWSQPKWIGQVQMWFILVENHNLDLTDSFWSWPFHFGQVQIDLVRPKPFWTDQNCFGHIEGQGISISPIQRIDQLLLKRNKHSSVRFYRFHSLLTTNWVLMMNLHLTSGTFFVLDINQITLKTKIENLINDQKSKRLNKRITLVVYITVSSMSNSIRGNLLIKKKSKTVLLLFIILFK